MTRLIDADELAHDLEHDVELCARALDDMNMVGKEREDMQWQKDCKQNCIWYISEQPTVEAIPITRCKDCKYWDGYYCHNKNWGDGYGNYTQPIKNEDGFCDWAERKEE